MKKTIRCLLVYILIGLLICSCNQNFARKEKDADFSGTDSKAVSEDVETFAESAEIETDVVLPELQRLLLYLTGLEYKSYRNLCSKGAWLFCRRGFDSRYSKSA